MKPNKQLVDVHLLNTEDSFFKKIDKYHYYQMCDNDNNHKHLYLIIKERIKIDNRNKKLKELGIK